MLDPRARRKDLTSRECASIYAGLIAGLVRVVDQQTVREMLRRIVTMIDSGWVDGDHDALTEQERLVVALVSNMFGCLEDNAPPAAALIALRWWAELSDEKWIFVVEQREGCPS